MADEEPPPATGSGSRLGEAVIIVSGTPSPNTYKATRMLTSTAVFVTIATLISLFSIWLQLKNYRKPLLQRYVVRILLMYHNQLFWLTGVAFRYLGFRRGGG
jgi:Organic solute transporter Ostalpha